MNIQWENSTEVIVLVGISDDNEIYELTMGLYAMSMCYANNAVDLFVQGFIFFSFILSKAACEIGYKVL